MAKLAIQKAKTAQEYYAKYSEDFKRSANTLFIGCVDSRVVAELLLDKTPGEMVVVRIPGALVPPQGLGDAAVSGAIELALQGGTIHDIIICGHTRCLMMNTLANDVDSFATPNLAKWANMADFVRAQATTQVDRHSEPERYVRALLEESIKRSLIGLRELPIVREGEASGQLTVHGWYYDLDSGDLVAYDETQDSFVVVNLDGSTSVPRMPDGALPPPPNSVDTPSANEAYVAASVGVGTGLASQSVAPESVAPFSVEPDSVEPAEVYNPSVEPKTVAPQPVDVPRAQPVQRVYASEISRAPQNNQMDSVNARQSAPQAEIVELAQPQNVPIPSNVQEAIDNPALDDMKALLGGIKRPSGRLQVRQTLNDINSRDGWMNVAKAVNEMRDPQVRQALREVAFELRSPQARAELRQIIADMDAGQLAQKLQNLNPTQIRNEFAQLIQQLRDEDK